MVPYERGLQQAIREVRESPFFEVQFEEVGPGGTGLDPTGIFELMAEDGFPLSERLKASYFPYRYMALHWHATDPQLDFVGDFHVMNIDAASEVRLNVDDFAWYDDDRPLLSELTLLDTMWRGGSGQVAAMRYPSGAASFEIWYLDRGHTFLQLDLDYRDYLDNLFLTKGVIGWQYLFADVNPEVHEFASRVNDLTAMLDQFPKLFPQYDYAPLRARLEARL